MKPGRIVQFFQVNRFRKELLIALLIKFSLLLLIAAVCFSHPSADQLSRDDLANRLFAGR